MNNFKKKQNYPYENLSLALQREMSDAIRPANNAVQSKNM